MSDYSVISTDTKREMYVYLLSNGRLQIGRNHNTDSDLKEYLRDQIRQLSNSLHRRLELYLCKSSIKIENGRAIIKKKYECKSNKLVYDTLAELEGCNTFTGSDENIELGEYLKKMDPINIEELWNIPENGSLDRKRLILACKLLKDFNHHDKQFGNKARTDEVNSFQMDKDSYLAEKVIAKISEEAFGDIANVRSQERLLTGKDFAQIIKPDTTLRGKDWLIVVDVKVYSKLTVEDGNYISNANRFQVNSYIGSMLDKYFSDAKNTKVLGIILHIVNGDLMDKHSEMHGCDLSLENNRKIKLYLIEDNGLNRILDEYTEIISKEIQELESNDTKEA